ncbi:hypothetical protein [Estrella lausannensis]|uniref:hypothetical protein n=1 Tax=Estrella lausannensis TaxID=483423 RepID=UPI001179E958|nr:hypothetical protein [Estrella lausannensis]
MFIAASPHPFGVETKYFTKPSNPLRIVQDNRHVHNKDGQNLGHPILSFEAWQIVAHFDTKETKSLRGETCAAIIVSDLWTDRHLKTPCFDPFWCSSSTSPFYPVFCQQQLSRFTCRFGCLFLFNR